MYSFSFKKHLRAVSAALSSLLMASGCHYDGRTSSSAGYNDYDPNSTPPFYRSFPQNQQYDGYPQSPAPQQMTPSVLPTPGYSEPSDSIPPSPTTQRSKRTLFPAGLKFPGFNRQTNQVNQASTRSANQGLAQRTAKSNGSPALPELSSTPSVVKRSESATRISDDAVRSVSKQDDADTNQTTKANTSEPNRHIVTRQWPSSRATLQPQLSDAESSNLESIKPPANVRSNAGDAPLLLPPPL
jgi:hypothetical protein